MSSALEHIQNAIYDFQEAANKVLAKEDQLYFGGRYLTGQLDRPEFLFLGINPGYGPEFADRNNLIKRKAFEPTACKFIDEYEDGLLLAKRIVDELLQGNPGKLKNYAETSISSFFATPDEPTLKKQLTALGPHGLQASHQQLMTESVIAIIDTINPVQVVCIGLTTFSQYLKLNGVGHNGVSMKSEKSDSGNSYPVYYKYTMINNRPVHGVLHLSGAHLSKIMRDNLRQIFSALT